MFVVVWSWVGGLGVVFVGWEVGVIVLCELEGCFMLDLLEIVV